MGVVEIVARTAQTQGPHRFIGFDFHFHEVFDLTVRASDLKRAAVDEIASRPP
jgi:hypothetical protein